jgi:hypothetical protein
MESTGKVKDTTELSIANFEKFKLAKQYGAKYQMCWVSYIPGGGK